MFQDNFIVREGDVNLNVMVKKSCFILNLDIIVYKNFDLIFR